MANIRLDSWIVDTKRTAKKNGKNKAYASASAQKRHIFSQWLAPCAERHLTRLWVHCVTVTNHWQEVAWREEGHHPADETTAPRILQLKRRRSLSLDT